MATASAILIRRQNTVLTRRTAIRNDEKIDRTAVYNNAVVKMRMGHEEGSTWRIREIPEKVSVLHRATSGILTAAIELTGFVHQTYLLVCVNLKRLCNTN